MRRIVFSRKGFDSQNGRVPSPIFEDGTVCSLPIPYSNSSLRFRDVRFRGESLEQLVLDLRGSATEGVHLDPDLAAESRPRLPGWRPCFGQIGTAQSHLAKKEVGPEDLFLFFGLFRPVERCAGRWRYVPKTRPIHLIFGWFQIGAVHRVDDSLKHRLPWAAAHPHLADRWTEAHNTLYVASDSLRINGQRTELPGAGVIRRCHDRLSLTGREERNTSVWHLPSWIMPNGSTPSLSYHESPDRWTRLPDCVRLQSVAKGQEFVLDAERHHQAIPWAIDLLRQAND